MEIVTGKDDSKWLAPHKHRRQPHKVFNVGFEWIGIRRLTHMYDDDDDEMQI